MQREQEPLRPRDCIIPAFVVVFLLFCFFFPETLKSWATSSPKPAHHNSTTR